MDGSTTTDERVSEPNRSISAVDFDWTATSFSSTESPDLSFSFQPRALQLRQNSRAPARLIDEEKEAIDSSEERSLDEEENLFELASARSEGSEDGTEEQYGDDQCQVINAKRELLERKGSTREKQKEIQRSSTLRVEPDREVTMEGDRSGSTNGDNFIDPLMFPTIQTRRLSSSIPPLALPSSTSPPRHDMTGRWLPSAPPPSLPFDIPTSPPRSPRSRFGSSTKSFTRRLSHKIKGNNDEDDFHWDTTIEIDSLPSTPTGGSTSKSRTSGIPLPSPLPFPSNNSPSRNSIPDLAIPPRSRSPNRHDSLALRRKEPLPPSPLLETSNFLLPLPSPAASSPRSRIDRDPSGYFRLPTSPSPSPTRSPFFDTRIFPPPPTPPAPSSANSSHFPLPPTIITPTTTIVDHFPETPSTTTTSRFSNSMNREKDLIVPKFVSVFIEPQKDHELDLKELYKEEFKTPKSSQLPPLRGTKTIFESIPGNNSSRNETKHRRSSTLRQRNPFTSVITSVKLNDEEKKQEVGDGRLNSNEKIDDGRIVNWLNHVKKEEEILKVSFRDTESTKDSWKGSLSNKSSRRGLKNRKISSFVRTKRGKWFLVGGLIILLLIVVGVTVAGLKQMKDNTHCSGGECSLNATCVDLGGNFIAQAFLDFADLSSATWDPPIDHSRLAYTLDHYVYPSSSSSCDSQLSLLSFPSLSSLPNHLGFSRLALLHTLSLTESNTTTFRLRHFISSLKNFPSSSDSKSLKPNSNFQIISGGFTWDFSTMMRSVQDVRWEDLMKPSSDSDSGEDEEELNRFEGRLDGLDRITSYAVASSAQRSEALKHYWIDTLEMEVLELEAFKEVVRSREVLIPIEVDELTKLQEFVAQRDNDVDILQGIGCRNGLGKAVTERVDEIEHGVFGLEEISTASNESCITRPIYGILNLFNLSNPFPHSLLSTRPSLPQSSLVLAQNVSNRISFHAGEIFSAGNHELPSSTTPLSAPTTIERFGLLNQIDHVLLDYLNLLEIDTARSLIRALLENSATSFSNTSAISVATNGFASIPMMEVQVWGGLRWNDIKEVRG